LHLDKDATKGPNIDALAVLGVANKELRRTIPAGGDVIGVMSAKGAKRPCKAKVTQAELVVKAEEEVLRFDVSVNDVVGVAVFNCTYKLAHEVTDPVLGQAIGIGFEVLKDGALNELKDKVHLATATENLNKLDDILVVAELLQEPDLPECGLAHLLIVIGVFELLHGDKLAGVA
jgi:hypothetical protein